MHFLLLLIACALYFVSAMSSPDLAGLSLEALEALSDSDENLRGDIEALEERWMNGCAEAVRAPSNG